MPARLAAALVSVVLLVIGALAAGPAYADTVGRGPDGQRLSVTRTSAIPLAGATVTVSGSGYDTAKGVYVAFCVDNGAGAPPSPCGGGIDTTGASGASHWISSNPPAYGEGLAVPYGSGGSFNVQLRLTATIGDVDCTVRRCVVASRNDHTRSSDRSQDVKVPVTFAAPAASPTTRAAAPTSPVPGGTTRTSAAPAPAASGAPSGTAPSTDAVGGSAAPEVGTVTGTGGTGTDPVSGDQQLLTTQVSDSGPAGRWFTVTVAGLAVLLVLLVVLRIRRRRQAQR
ncbi:hypothetical protein ACIBMZ_15010 [Micromonospora sp. NPDC049900]|uniref:hypothetical protein n=1 Tax=Micromonospora sp. NPDC049900 TaxID=3364275 RepID=UPI0037B5861C